MRIEMTRVLPLLLCSVLACAGRQQNVQPQGSSPTAITLEELRASNAQNVYQLIQALRPNWLQPNSQSLANPTAGQVVVYLDGTRMGGVDFLRQIATATVQSAQYLNATEASSRYGLNHTGGAILVVTRR